jgi:hypothetical protein
MAMLLLLKLMDNPPVASCTFRERSDLNHRNEVQGKYSGTEQTQRSADRVSVGKPPQRSQGHTTERRKRPTGTAACLSRRRNLQKNHGYFVDPHQLLNPGKTAMAFRINR